MRKNVKKNFRKPRKGAKRNPKVRRVFTKDPTITILNDRPTFNRKLYCTKTCSEYQTYSWTATQTPAAFFKFDPSGTYGNGSNAGAPLKVADWDNLCTIYDQYKVKSITINIRFENGGSTNVSYPIWIRYGYDSLITVPNIGLMNELPRVVRKTFTNENTTVSYKFYPKCQILSAGTISGQSITGGLGTTLKSQPFTDTDRPIELTGFMIFAQNALPSNCNLYMSYEYELAFKYHT